MLHREALSDKRKVVIFGVSYALLDLAEATPDFPSAVIIIIETGGNERKKKRNEQKTSCMELKEGFNVRIFPEYGMCELLLSGI